VVPSVSEAGLTNLSSGTHVFHSVHASLWRKKLRIVDNKALLLKVENPAKVTMVIPKSKQLGANEVLVNWGVEEAKVLRNLNIKAPSPIEGRYDWPGKYKPFKHQIETAAFFTMNQRAYCFSEMGVGKTASAIWASDYLLKNKIINRVLVVCPLSIMDAAWRNDLFTVAMHRTVDVAHGSADKRRKVIQGNSEYVIINFDGIKTVHADIANGGFDLIIIDEVSAYKNAQTDRWKTLNSLIKPTTWLWMMTGTPAAQSPVDAYGLAKMMNPNTVPRYFGSFRDMVMRKVTNFKWAPKPDAMETVHRVLQPAIRFTKEECLDMPPMIYVKRDVPLSKQQEKYYKEFKKKMVLYAAGEEITAPNAAIIMNKLLQLSCLAEGTEVLTNRGWIPIEKVALDDLVWDGIEWVKHDGCVFKGFKSTISLKGVRLTPDHEVLTVDGWEQAGSLLYGKPGDRLDRLEVRLPEGFGESGHLSWENQESKMAMCLRLWKNRSSGESISEKQTPTEAEKLWLRSRKSNSQNEQHKAGTNMAWHEAAMPKFREQGLEKLRRSRDNSLQSLVGVFRKLLGAYGTWIQQRINSWSNRQQWSLLTRELQVGNSGTAIQQYSKQREHRHTQGEDDDNAGSQSFRIKDSNSTCENSKIQMACGYGAANSNREKVYDLVNCGIRNRFVVRGRCGELLIVHNCGAVYSDNNETIEFDISSRYKVLQEIIAESSKKVLVFAPFKHVIDLLMDMLRGDKISCDMIRGDVSPGKRTEIFARFQEHPDPKVLVIQPQAAAHGVTLTAANTVVWWGPTSSLEIYHQANARVHRSGQTHPCTVVQLQGSPVEKHVYTLLDNRIDVHSKIVELYKKMLD